MEESRGFYLIIFWLLFISGLASYYYAFVDYGFIITVGVTFFTGLLAALAAFAINNRLLMGLGILLTSSTIIFIGILFLSDVFF